MRTLFLCNLGLTLSGVFSTSHDISFRSYATHTQCEMHFIAHKEPQIGFVLWNAPCSFVLFKIINPQHNNVYSLIMIVCLFILPINVSEIFYFTLLYTKTSDILYAKATISIHLILKMTCHWTWKFILPGNKQEKWHLSNQDKYR